jgi:hypothetical protein
MKQEKNLLSSFTPKKPSDGLKQRVLDAATGAVEEPVIYEPFFGKLDWGLLAASMILAATLALINGNGSASKENGGARSPELSAAEQAMSRELGIPGFPRRPVQQKRVKTEDYLREIGG